MVIDPFRDVGPYLRIADRLGVKVTHALATHLHNDFVSGHRELQAAAGTDIAELTPGHDRALGGITFQALHTPGHTPDHRSYLLIDRGRPRALFAGGGVMIGAIARTDLFGAHLAVQLAMEGL